MENPPKAVIFGCKGLQLSEEEVLFFQQHKPMGFILFKRNCENKEQVRNLVEFFKFTTNNPNALILIDQEGGRVSRLKEPTWREFPPAGDFANMIDSQSLDSAKVALYNNYQEICADLTDLGINVNCAPTLDLLIDGCHGIIGDRALGKTPEQVSELGRVVCNAHLENDVLPVIKHIPGHGRAMCDSHEDLPIVNESLDTLKQTDFAPFKSLSDAPLAMTAHIVYTQIDAENTATMSSKIIKIIRDYIGFKGLLMTDDLSMKALSGSFTEKTRKSLEAGCDLILHCNGDISEMVEIAENTPHMSDKLMTKYKNIMRLI